LTKQYEGTDSIYSSDIAEKIDKAQPAGGKAGSGSAADDEGGSGDVDEYFAEAGRFIIEKEKASIGMLQRVYKIGFNRAARIMDQLCEAGVVGPEQGTKPREILMTLEDFDNYLEMH
ncbi:MAG: DNA translocase FtsK, partial [Lachnospiraceae bacterium]|nr:DNA translocase FtsK [Lachnospiraceae bacterium]